MQVWLINTGWSGGPYGTGERIKLAGMFADNFQQFTHDVSDEIRTAGPRKGA